ncbi:MAG: hypothetical protein U0401_32800 [Anaerolineae bacterium]
MTRICDYGSSRRTEFWEGQHRAYEDGGASRHKALPPQGRRLIEIGAYRLWPFG